MSAGGMHTGDAVPSEVSQAYAGRPVKRRGQSAGVRQVAVQPMPVTHRPVAQSAAALHRASMSTQIGVAEPPTLVHA